MLSAEQAALRDSARKLARERLPAAHLRELRDRRDPDGFSRALWREMCELGWAGIPFPEEVGGAGLGLVELGLVAEELGRTLAPTPLLATVVLGGGAVLLGGSEAQRRAILPELCAGRRLLALAHDEGTRHEPYRIATRAERSAGGFRLTGEKSFVLDGGAADTLVVVARTAGAVDERAGLTLLLVPRAAAAAERLWMVDSRHAARVRFDGAALGEEDVLGRVGQGADLLDRVLDRGRAALAAEMLGGLQEAFAVTVEYLKTRRQFGVPIGSFQALKHRAAQMFCEIELCKSIAAEALRALDEDRPDAPQLASAAKARASDVFLLVANEAVQMHGGIGVTDELDLGFYLKRARVAEQTLGTAAFHRDRFARLQGY